MSAKCIFIVLYHLFSQISALVAEVFPTLFTSIHIHNAKFFVVKTYSFLFNIGSFNISMRTFTKSWHRIAARDNTVFGFKNKHRYMLNTNSITFCFNDIIALHFHIFPNFVWR